MTAPAISMGPIGPFVGPAATPQRRSIPILGGIFDGMKYRGRPGVRFAEWIFPSIVPGLATQRGHDYRLVDCGGWWAYVPERFDIVSPPDA